MSEDSVEFTLFNHYLRFNLAQDITLHEFVETCLDLNGIPLARSEIGISLPCLDFTPELIARNDVQEMINENPYVQCFFKDKYMNGIKSICFNVYPYSNSIYWDTKHWLYQCDENPDEVYMSKGKSELLFLVDNVKSFEPDGFSEKEYDTIITVLSVHGFEFDE